MPFLAIFRPFWPIWACSEPAHGPDRQISGYVRGQFRARSGLFERPRGLRPPRTTSKHRPITPTRRYDPDRSPPKNAIFGSFFGHFGPFWPSFGPKKFWLPGYIFGHNFFHTCPFDKIRVDSSANFRCATFGTICRSIAFVFAKLLKFCCVRDGRRVVRTGTHPTPLLRRVEASRSTLTQTQHKGSHILPNRPQMAENWHLRETLGGGQIDP